MLNLSVTSSIGISFNDDTTQSQSNICCDSVDMDFSEKRAGTTVTGQIYVYNCGELGSYLDWYVDTVAVPAWGVWTFTPEYGTGLAEGDFVIIDVTCKLTDQFGIYSGEIRVYNDDNSSDFCLIDSSVEVPRERSYNALTWSLFQQFPLLEVFLRILNL